MRPKVLGNAASSLREDKAGFLLLLMTSCMLLVISAAQRPDEQGRDAVGYQNDPNDDSQAPSSAWTTWSGWSKCSRTCSGGVREQFRQCRATGKRLGELLDPSDQTASKCEGGDRKYQACQNAPCAGERRHGRRAQCAKYNTRSFGGKTYLWEPMNRGGPCQLHCRARGHRFFVRQSSRLTDGAACGSGRRGGGRRRGREMCVNGQCVVPGCDDVIGSRKVVDRCGECGGEGRSCEYVSGLFRLQSLSNDFHRIVTIPAGAKKINITELSSSASYIALRSGNSRHVMYINGEVGRGIPDQSRSYVVGSTTFDYQRPFNSPKGESLRADGPTSEPLDVLIFFQFENPGIRYEFVVPKIIAPPRDLSPRRPPGPARGPEDRIDAGDEGLNLPPQHRPYNNPQNPPVRRPLYTNSFQPSNRYSKPIGTRYTNPHRLGNTRYRAESTGPLRWPSRRYQTNEEVDHASDDAGTASRRDAPPIVNRQTSIDGATYWTTRGYGPCSKSCAQGVKTQIVLCVHESTQQVVSDQHCPQPRPVPKSKSCNKNPCPPYYHVSDWSVCSRTCGNGRRTRSVICRQQFPGNFTTAVFHKKCRRLPKPNTHEKCQVAECARWEVVGEWSQCSVKCGSGSQSRHAECRSGSGRTLPEAACSSTRRPSFMRQCDAGPCVTQWFVTEWQACSADCDRGVQRRSVHCLNTAQSASGCPSHHRPHETRSCARSSCGVKYEWFAGDWGTCSSKCGAGQQTRSVICVRVEPDGSVTSVMQSEETGRLPCNANTKLATEQPCNTQSCGSRWYQTQWTECSVSCGGGSRSRDVQCLDEEGRFSSLCDAEDKPRGAERCNTANCISLNNPSCTDKLRNCHVILRARLCAYTYYRSKCCLTCSDPAAALRPSGVGK